ncbi:single-stranded DNA-binding protein [Candidatus Nomurabacteria bacterium]|nr:single-stranded DNA-binding protein [Candidatus Nomurabacteria bacterium]
MYLNKAIVIGNLTRDPELRAIPSGTKVCSFSVATNRVWKDKNGMKQEDTQYHNCVVFGSQAENVAQYLRKGSSVLVEGRLQTRSWDAQDGKKQYRTEIVADRVQFGPKNASAGYSSGSSGGGSVNQDSTTSGSDNLKTIQYPEEEINPDDIPF